MLFDTALSSSTQISHYLFLVQRKIRIAIILKNHDHPAEKYSRSPKIFNSDGWINHSIYLYQNLNGTVMQANRSF